MVTIAINTSDANTQHYEVPTEFYLKVLGPNLKYSSCYYESPDETLQPLTAAVSVQKSDPPPPPDA